MSTRKVAAVEHTCDGCGKVQYEVEGEPPMWLYFDWVEVSIRGGSGGKFEACNERCAIKALKIRNEIEQRFAER